MDKEMRLVFDNMRLEKELEQYRQKDAPTVDAVAVRYEQWVQPLITGTKRKNPYCFCTGCALPIKPSKKTKYCPNCGCRMGRKDGEG